MGGHMTSDTYLRQSAENLRALRTAGPLVHNITNYVVMNFCANVLLSIGASPIMAHAKEEMEEMASIAGAVVLNIGTLSVPWVESMVLAGKTASKLGKPVVLDPVGAGASRMRTEAALRIIDEAGVCVIRGNASEILALRKAGSQTKGVDSVHGVEEAAEVAKDLAASCNCVVAVTGEVDLVTDGKTTLHIANGHPMMRLVTGMGCSASAVMGAFLAVEKDRLAASAAALACFGLAGEAAAVKSQAPGSFGITFIDSLYELAPETVETAGKISIA